MNDATPSKPANIDCFKCRHFYITWEPNKPRGCKAFGFKTSKLPSIVIFETSGENCLKFSPKNTPPPSPKKKQGWIA